MSRFINDLSDAIHYCKDDEYNFIGKILALSLLDNIHPNILKHIAIAELQNYLTENGFTASYEDGDSFIEYRYKESLSSYAISVHFSFEKCEIVGNDEFKEYSFDAVDWYKNAIAHVEALLRLINK